MAIPWAAPARSLVSIPQRSMTSPTGSVPAKPKVPASRVVVKAVTPKSAKSEIGSCGVCISLRVPAVSHALNIGAQRVQALVDPLIPTFDLPNIVDNALPLGAEGGDEHGHPSADIWRIEH